MNPLEAAVLVVLLFLPFHCLVAWQFGRQEDPAYLRAHGIVVVRNSAFDAHAEPIGEFMGHPIWGTITFKGMVYRFSRVTKPCNRERIRPHELYLDPGLVYVTD